MTKVYLIFTLLVIAPYTYSQFNQDSKEIKARKIKSITFPNEAQCKFDKEGRLIEYIKGDINQNLEESNIPYGQIYKYTVDTLGNFTKLIGLDFSSCRDSICQPDTICYQYWNLSGMDLDFSYGWEYMDSYGELSSRDLEGSIYLREVFGDTIVEKIHFFDRDRRPNGIKISFTVELQSRRTLYFETEVPFQYLYSDSVRYFLDSLEYGSRIIVDYSKKRKIKSTTTINSNGDTTKTCSRFKDKGNYYSCTCETRQGKKETFFSKKAFKNFSNKVRVEQDNRIEFTTNPSSILPQYQTKIEYYE